jgi:hypothetical protein
LIQESGVEMSDAEYEASVSKRCEEVAVYLLTEKGKRIAERISLHLPGMIENMMVLALKGETVYDFFELTKALDPAKTPLSLKEFKKRIQDAAWRGVKPHLPSTKHIRTPALCPRHAVAIRCHIARILKVKSHPRTSLHYHNSAITGKRPQEPLQPCLESW